MSHPNRDNSTKTKNKGCNFNRTRFRNQRGLIEKKRRKQPQKRKTRSANAADSREFKQLTGLPQLLPRPPLLPLLPPPLGLWRPWDAAAAPPGSRPLLAGGPAAGPLLLLLFLPPPDVDECVRWGAVGCGTAVCLAYLYLACWGEASYLARR